MANRHMKSANCAASAPLSVTNLADWKTLNRVSTSPAQHACFVFCRAAAIGNIPSAFCASRPAGSHQGGGDGFNRCPPHCATGKTASAGASPPLASPMLPGMPPASAAGLAPSSSESSDSPPAPGPPRGGGGAVGDSAPLALPGDEGLGSFCGSTRSARSSRSRPSLVPYAKPPPCSEISDSKLVDQVFPCCFGTTQETTRRQALGVGKVTTI